MTRLALAGKCGPWVACDAAEVPVSSARNCSTMADISSEDATVDRNIERR
jgi:hypothetical protein